MILDCHPAGVSTDSIPRESGDDPWEIARVLQEDGYSPRERG